MEQLLTKTELLESKRINQKIWRSLKDNINNSPIVKISNKYYTKQQIIKNLLKWTDTFDLYENRRLEKLINDPSAFNQHRSYDLDAVIIIINYNNKKLTLDSIQSLIQSINKKSKNKYMIGLLIVDNSNNREEIVDIKDINQFQSFQYIGIINGQGNIGYAGSVNLALYTLNDLKIKYWIISNNDIFYDSNSDVINTLIDYANQLGQFGMIQPAIFFDNEKNKIWGYGGGYDGYLIRNGEKVKDRDNNIVKIDYALGAMFLTSYTTLEIVGGMQHELFMYYDEIEWSMRLKAYNLNNYCIPICKVYHRISETSGGRFSPLMCYYLARNNIKVWRKHKNIIPDSYKIKFFKTIRKSIIGGYKLKKYNLITATFKGIYSGIFGDHRKQIYTYRHFNYQNNLSKK